MTKDAISRRLTALEGAGHGPKIHVIDEGKFPSPQACTAEIEEIERTAAGPIIIIKVIRDE